MFVAALAPATAQTKLKASDRHAMRREMHEFKLKYLAQEMDLRDNQKKEFVEVYNQMSSERRAVMKETRELEKKLADAKDASDADYEAVTKALTTAKEKDAAIEKKYDEKFATFLTAKQIFRMKAAEEQFRAKMHEMKKKK